MIKVEAPKRVTSPKPRGRRFLVWLGRIVAGVLGLMLLGAGYESVSEAADARTYSPPGQMVDVGGFRLHLHCAGTGSPTVVVEAGWGDWSASWSSWVQPGVAKTTRICIYDRAGMGYSEAGPLPRSAENFVPELHTLLHQGGVPGPYVMVGHSMGGFMVRMFAHQYASEVSGVVLIESMSPSGAKPSTMPSPRASPPTIPDSTARWVLTLPARIGLVRLLSGPIGMKPASLPPEEANAYVAYSVTPLSLETVLEEGQGMSESSVQAGAIQSLGAMPLIVLSRGRAEDKEQEWQQQQTESLQLSSNSQQLFADKSGHNIQSEQPDAAIGAIVTMVEQIRRPATP